MPDGFKDHGGVYRVRAFQALNWLDHGFGTRNSPAFDALPATQAKQVHSDRVLTVREASTCAGVGDALVTDRPGLRLAVRTADCIPVLLVDREKRVVAAVHAGWRGTLAGIAQRTVETMTQKFGCAPEDLEAALGPGIGACCFEVGPEVAKLFDPQQETKTRLDLHGLNRRQLISAGLRPAKIHLVGLCTRCAESDFYSFRRDGARAGRMVSSIALLETRTSLQQPRPCEQKN
ncbi:MAG: peptidoglycan editing factor PgeF [Bryobacteraceae bacterium]|nr:peptidoglycan editing factor PgeF [Bryobacteraceae bacterium]MDW8377542.1 peptidoglycan editing factor PgeF [Bryobacterales bacterium]